MSHKWTRSKKSTGPKAQARRRGALDRLKDNLKNPRFMYADPKINEIVQRRMKKEIAVLQTRLGIAA